MSNTDTSELTPQMSVQMMKESNSPHPWWDRAIMKMDGFVYPAIEDRHILTPVGGESAGEMWLIDGVGTGDWEHQDDKLALYYPQFDTFDQRDDWMFIPVFVGMQLWVKDEQVIITNQAASTWFSAALIADHSAGDLPGFAAKVDAVIAAGGVYEFNRAVLIATENACLVTLDRTLSAPPVFPASNGDAYLVVPNGTGAWRDHDGAIAYYYNGWRFIIPKTGFKAYDVNTGVHWTYNGGGWFGDEVGVPDVIGSTLAAIQLTIDAILPHCRQNGHAFCTGT